MSVSKIANRYAKSLIDLGKEKGVLETIISDVSAFIEMAENKEFSIFLKSPIIKSEKKLLVFEELLRGKVHDESMAFFRMVIKKGRENILVEILKNVLARYKEMQGVTTVILTSATELSEDEFKKISDVIVANRLSENLLDVQTKVYTRDIFNSDS